LAVPIAIAVAPPLDPFGEFIDIVDAARRVHPAGVGVEALIDEELAPGRRAIGTKAFVTRHLQFRAEVEAGVRIDEEQRAAVGGQLRGDRNAVRATRLSIALGGGELGLAAVESRKIAEVDPLDVAADAAFGEA